MFIENLNFFLKKWKVFLEIEQQQKQLTKRLKLIQPTVTAKKEEENY